MSKLTLKSLERREEVKKLIQNFGYWNLPAKSIAQKWGVTDQTIRKDVKAILKLVGKTELNDIKTGIGIAFHKALHETLKLMNDPDKRIRLEAIRTFNTTQQRYTEMLENYGLKEKVANELVIDQRVSIKAVKEWIHKTVDVDKLGPEALEVLKD